MTSSVTIIGLGGLKFLLETNLVFCLFKDKRAAYTQWVVGLKKLISRMLKSWFNILLASLLFEVFSDSSREHCPEQKKKRWFYFQVAIISPKPQMALTQLINMACLPVSLVHPVLPFLLSLKSFFCLAQLCTILASSLWVLHTTWVLQEHFCCICMHAALHMCLFFLC